MRFEVVAAEENYDAPMTHFMGRRIREDCAVMVAAKKDGEIYARLPLEGVATIGIHQHQSAAMAYLVDKCAATARFTTARLTWRNSRSFVRELTRFVRAFPLERIEIVLAEQTENGPPLRATLFEALRASPTIHAVHIENWAWLDGSFCAVVRNVAPLERVTDFHGDDLVFDQDEATLLRGIFRLFPSLTRLHIDTLSTCSEIWAPTAPDFAAIAEQRSLAALSRFSVTPDTMHDFIAWARTTTVEDIDFTHGFYDDSDSECDESTFLPAGISADWRQDVYAAIRANPCILTAECGDDVIKDEESALLK